jgi:hypothetical protein
MTTNMKTTAKHLAPWLAAFAVGATIVLAPIANADTNPLVPYGTHATPAVPGYHVDDQDDANTTNGFRDAPF